MLNPANSVEAPDVSSGPFQALFDLARELLDAPIAVVSLLTPEQTILQISDAHGSRRIPRPDSLADLVATQGPGGAIVVEDAAADARFRGHPMLRQPSPVRFYAGVSLRGSDGQPVGAFGVMGPEPRTDFGADHLARLRRLAALAEGILAGIEDARLAEERLHTLSLVEQMSGVGHWRMDVATGAVRWSDEIYRIHGVTREAFESRIDKAIDFYPPGDAAALTALIGHAAATGEGYETRLTLIRADGEKRRVLSRADAERDETGAVVALFGVFKDTTEEDKLLETARKNESRYRVLADNVDDVITRVKLDGASKYISPSVKALLGWTREEMTGQAADYVYPDDRPAVLAAVMESARTGKATRLEHRVLHRDGSAVWVECAFRTIADGAGGPAEVFTVIRNIDRRKALEREVIEARDRAEAAAAAKSEFLANMSHELRTPLTGVIGFADLLRRSEALEPEDRGHVERIATASDALLAVINDILDYSKLEVGGIEMDPHPFRPADLARCAAAIVEGQCALKGLSLSVEIAPDLPEALVGDEARLRQVLLNLLSNAAKFTAEGGVALKLTTRPGSGAGDWTLRAEVADTGIGIAPDKLAQVFERFSQADASTTRVYGGTGLGLAISRRLIDAMGGDLGVDSRPGEGSTFWFEVALPQGSLAAELRGSARSGAAMEGHVLVADDVEANRQLVGALLRSLGLTYDLVSDGAEAVHALQTQAYDLVLMDVHMPVMDGLAATQALRRLQSGGDVRTPVLALTANVQPDQVERCLEAGMDGHLGKPIQVPALVAALGRWLG